MKIKKKLIKKKNQMMTRIKNQIKILRKRLLKINQIRLQILMVNLSNKRRLQFFKKFSQRLNLLISKLVIIYRLKSKKKKKTNQKNLKM